MFSVDSKLIQRPVSTCYGGFVYVQVANLIECSLHLRSAEPLVCLTVISLRLQQVHASLASWHIVLMSHSGPILLLFPEVCILSPLCYTHLDGMFSLGVVFHYLICRSCRWSWSNLYHQLIREKN
jgi:hypothetical protein